MDIEGLSGMQGRKPVHQPFEHDVGSDIGACRGTRRNMLRLKHQSRLEDSARRELTVYVQDDSIA